MSHFIINLSILSEVSPVEKSDTFRFHCTQCGKCCKNRRDIVLSPFDVHRISRHLKMRPSDFFERYCRWGIHTITGLPRVILESEGPGHGCVLLKENRCMVQEAKPSICALYPLGRMVTDKDTVEYIISRNLCNAGGEEHTVKEWLDAFGMEETEDWFIEWNRDSRDLSYLLLEGHSEDCQSLLDTIILTSLYLSYDTGKDFLPQYRANIQQARFLIEAMGELRSRR